MKPEEIRDEWLDRIRAETPNGLTVAQFRRYTLQSATLNDDGECWPPQLASWFLFHQVLMSMFMDGLIRRKHHRHDQPILPYMITDKGRAMLAALTQEGRG